MKFICASGNMIVAEDDGKYYVATAEHPVWVQIRSSSNGLRGKVLDSRPAWDKLVSEGGKISDTPCSDAIMEAALESVNKLAMPEKLSEKLEIAVVCNNFSYFDDLYKEVLRLGESTCNNLFDLYNNRVSFETENFSWNYLDSCPRYRKFDVAVRTSNADALIWRYIIQNCLNDPLPNSKSAHLKVKEFMPEGWKEIRTKTSKYRTTAGSLDSFV